MVKVRDVMGMMGSWVDFMYKYISISFSGVKGYIHNQCIVYISLD